VKENNVMRMVWGAVAHLGTRLFRLNTGRGWISGLGPDGVIQLTDGSVVIKAARSIAIGFSTPSGDALKGASDLQGWTSIVVTPELVGRRVAIYTAIETKNSTGGTKRKEQKNFIEQICGAGGIAGFASSPEQAQGLVRDFNGAVNK